MTGARREGLVDALRGAHLPSVGDVRAATPLSGGASRETWALDASDGDGRPRPLILQLRQPPTWDDGLDVGTEARLITAAAAAGVPVPGLVAWDADGATLGEPFLLFERVEGEAIPQRILRDDRFAAARPLLAGQYGEALGRVQAIPLRDVAGLRTADPLEYCRSILDRSGHPHPALEYGLRWLERNDPRRGDGPVVVHGDYRSGNGIVDEHGLRAVIDWELSRLGDPVEDLGWVCNRAWRFGEPLAVGGFGTYEQLLDGYERTSGRRVDRDVLRWWEVLGSVRWAAICMTSGVTHLSGHRRSIELAAVGRRVCEAEFDMLLLLP